MSAPLLLAVESATSVLSVALLRGEELLLEERAPAGSAAAESLLPAVDALLRRAGVGVGDLAAFAVSVGPGSFTGLRIGIATVKGLAFGGACPVAPVRTLEALALAAGGAEAGEGPVVAVLDARRGEVYAWGSEGVAEGVYTPEALAQRLPTRCVLVGEGVAICGHRVGPGVRRVAPPRGDARARHVGALGARRLAAGGGIAAAALVPRYVRRAEAEVKRTGERFEL